MSRPTRNPDPPCAPKSSDAPPAPIAQYVPLHPDTIQRLLTRFRREGLAVVEDRPPPGRAPVLTPERRTTLVECLRPPERVWTCAQLAEVVQQQYGVTVRIETIRPLLRQTGFGGATHAVCAR